MSKQEQVINDYLQALLEDVEDTSHPVDVVKPVQQLRTIGLETLVAEVPETVTEISTETIVETPIVETQTIAAVVEVEQALNTELKTDVIPQAIIPDWAQEDFQCLLFTVSGLKLAVPLVKLSSVMPWSKKLVETPNNTDWYLGLINNHGTNVKVIDTALMVLPENRHVDISQSHEDRFSHVLLVNDSTWGLTCDSIGDVIWMSAEQVKWRSNTTKRPWLAGTSREQLCALMDTEVFADMINKITACDE